MAEYFKVRLHIAELITLRMHQIQLKKSPQFLIIKCSGLGQVIIIISHEGS